jgi:hypothetical protein
VIHYTELVVGIRIPGPIDREWAGGLAAISVAQIRRDHAVLALKLFDWVKWCVPGEEADGRIQTTTGDK